MAYKPKSKRTNSPVGPQGKKLLDGLTANKNIDDIRALSKISNTQSKSISNLDTEINSANQRISQISTSKQDKLTLTTVGTSGPATLNNNNLNVPNYSTGLTVGATPIAGGTVGRILFEGTGNVLQESSNLFWNSTNNRLGIGTSTPAYSIENFIPNVFGGSNVGLFISDFNLSFSGSSSWLAWGRSNTQLGQSSGIRALWLGNNGFEQGIAFHTASGGNGALSNISVSEAMRITNTKNLLINTTTDAGYRLDVAGTIRSQGSLVILNPAFTFGGSITHSANATLVIAGGPGGGENITIGPSNRIFINAQQSRFPNGSVQMASTLTLGNSTNATSTNMLLMQGSITAGFALGRGIGMDTTLVAAANNDVLIGVDINPTFTNGAFTGVQNYVARLGGHIGVSTANAFGLNYISFSALTSNQGISAGFAPNGTPTGYGYNFQFSKSSTSNANGLLFIGGGASAGGNSANKHVISTSADGTALGQQLVLRAATTSQSWSLVNDHLSIFPTGNVVIQNASPSATDAGFRLDVNGTARVQGVITGSVNSGGLTLGAASANQVAISLSGYFTGLGAINISNSNPRGYNLRINAQGEGGFYSSVSSGNFQGFASEINYFKGSGSIDVINPIAGSVIHGYLFNPTITNQGLAFVAGFRSILASATNRWNLYIDGTASNYLASNLLINTTTDAGFRFDVNGTARVQGLIQGTTSAVGTMLSLAGANNTALNVSNDSSGRAFIEIKGNTSATSVAGAYFTADGFQEAWFNVISRQASTNNKIWRFGNLGGNNYFAIQKLNDAGDTIVSTALTVFSSTSNIGINTTTDAGFRLDVNGTARVTGNFNVSGGQGITTINPNTITGGTDFFVVKTASFGTYIVARENGRLFLGSTTGSRLIVFEASVLQYRQQSEMNFNNGGLFSPLNQLNQAGIYVTANYTNAGAGGTSEGALFQFQGNTATTIGNVTLNQISMKPTYNNTGGTTINRGFFYNPTLTSMTNTTHYAFQSTSGAVVINSSSPNASSVLQADSTTQGFLPPRMTNAQMIAIATPAEGLVVYDTTNRKLCCYDGATWQNLF